jgi:gamma-glutamylcyclotransferase (GGCT)/AIG2-like uncharacterized protein YtfP
MTDLVFFYGTLMSSFQRQGRDRLGHVLRSLGRGSISASLFDLGIYPAAVPDSNHRVLGEVNQMLDSDAVLAVLDEIEGYSEGELEKSLYVRQEIPVTLDDGHLVRAWVYFYNAPLGRAPRIESGDYLEHLGVRQASHS